MRWKIVFYITILFILTPLFPPLLKGGQWGVIFAQQKEGKQENVCIQCHSQLGGKFAEPVEQWGRSIHKEMGNNCEGCHGGDASDMGKAMTKEAGFIGKPTLLEIPDFCGKCHIGVKENYSKSAHGLSAAKTGAPNCITCHGNHEIKKASLELINEKNCTRCHTYDKPQKIKQALFSTDKEIARLTAMIKDVKGSSIDTKRLEDKLFAARNAIHQVTHVLSVDRINAIKITTDKELSAVDESLKTINKEITKRKRIAIGASLFCFFAAAVVILYRKTFIKPENWFKV